MAATTTHFAPIISAASDGEEKKLSPSATPARALVPSVTRATVLGESLISDPRAQYNIETIYKGERRASYVSAGGEYFRVGTTIGRGVFGAVREIVHHESGEVIPFVSKKIHPRHRRYDIYAEDERLDKAFAECKFYNQMYGEGSAVVYVTDTTTQQQVKSTEKEQLPKSFLNYRRRLNIRVIEPRFDGPTLSELFRGTGSTQHVLFERLHQTAQALDYMHEKKDLVHGDGHFGNVKVTQGGVALIDGDTVRQTNQPTTSFHIYSRHISPDRRGHQSKQPYALPKQDVYAFIAEMNRPETLNAFLEDTVFSYQIKKEFTKFLTHLKETHYFSADYPQNMKSIIEELKKFVEMSRDPMHYFFREHFPPTSETKCETRSEAKSETRTETKDEVKSAGDRGSSPYLSSDEIDALSRLFNTSPALCDIFQDCLRRSTSELKTIISIYRTNEVNFKHLLQRNMTGMQKIQVMNALARNKYPEDDRGLDKFTQLSLKDLLNSAKAWISLDEMEAAVAAYHRMKGWFRNSTQTMTDLDDLRALMRRENILRIPREYIVYILKESESRPSGFRLGFFAENRSELASCQHLPGIEVTHLQDIANHLDVYGNCLSATEKAFALLLATPFDRKKMLKSRCFQKVDPTSWNANPERSFRYL